METKMKITWNISQLDRNTADGFVTTAHWTVSATEVVVEETNDDQPIQHIFSASSYGSCGFDGELTTLYEDLTKEQVLGWVWEKVNKEEIEGNLASQIEAQKNPVTATGVPW
jgi:hypothetical protein